MSYSPQMIFHYEGSATQQNCIRHYVIFVVIRQRLHQDYISLPGITHICNSRISYNIQYLGRLIEIYSDHKFYLTKDLQSLYRCHLHLLTQLSLHNAMTRQITDDYGFISIKSRLQITKIMKDYTVITGQAYGITAMLQAPCSTILSVFILI